MGHCFFKVRRGKQEDQKQVLMFARLSAEKESSDCYAIEKAKSKRAEELEFCFFIKRTILTCQILMQNVSY